MHLKLYVQNIYPNIAAQLVVSHRGPASDLSFCWFSTDDRPATVWRNNRHLMFAVGRRGMWINFVGGCCYQRIFYTLPHNTFMVSQLYLHLLYLIFAVERRELQPRNSVYKLATCQCFGQNKQICNWAEKKINRCVIPLNPPHKFKIFQWIWLFTSISTQLNFFLQQKPNISHIHSAQIYMEAVSVGWWRECVHSSLYKLEFCEHIQLSD